MEIHKRAIKRFIIPFLFIFVFTITVGCSEDEPKIELTSDYLEATTWDAELTGSTYPNSYPISAHFILQFLTKDSGKCVPAYGDAQYEGSFTYGITKDMILFNGSLTGYWTLIERKKNQMTLQSFQPNEFRLVLTKK